MRQHIVSMLHIPVRNMIQRRCFCNCSRLLNPRKAVALDGAGLGMDPKSVFSSSTTLESIIATPSQKSKFKSFFYKSDIPEERQVIIDNSSIRIYVQCSTGIDFVRLCKDLQLPDVFLSWFNLTMLHLWLVMFRVSKDYNMEEVLRMRDNIFLTLWDDVEKRFDDLKQEWGLKQLKQKDNFGYLHNKANHAILSYDASILGHDTELANVVWRTLYDHEAVEPDSLSRAVKYIRKQVFMLERISVDKIENEGILVWDKSGKKKDFQTF